MATIKMGSGSHRFEIKATTLKMVDDVETTIVDTYVKIGTKSEQNPNDWSDFSEFCSPNEGDGVISSTLEVLTDVKTEIDYEYTLKVGADGLMDNFGNIYACVDTSN